MLAKRISGTHFGVVSGFGFRRRLNAFRSVQVTVAQWMLALTVWRSQEAGTGLQCVCVLRSTLGLVEPGWVVSGSLRRYGRASSSRRCMFSDVQRVDMV